MSPVVTVASVEYGARYVEAGNMTDDTIADDQIVSWYEGVAVIKNALPVVSNLSSHMLFTLFLLLQT